MARRRTWLARRLPHTDVVVTALLVLLFLVVRFYPAAPSAEHTLEHPQPSILGDSNPKSNGGQPRPRRRGGGKGEAPSRPPYGRVSLDLRLTDAFAHRAVFATKKDTFTRFGFDLRKSNELPLDRTLPDYRSPRCRALDAEYPPAAVMPKVSVIVIFYNEALSTLLRNIVSVLNSSPHELLGEIVLVDDNSTLDELSLLPEHLARLTSQLPPQTIRLVRRAEHSGIVGARIRGAKEAVHPVILFLDSHAEVAPGWLQPLVGRIHEDRTRVVIPNIRGFHLDTLEIYDSKPWPPFRGVLSWRLGYVPVIADLEQDLLDPAHPEESPVRCPVMPGGLFAMDRSLFFELGEYDPEIFFYGGEHIDLSLRVWMCGGSIEVVPCSNVGHIYREFNRFSAAQDPLIQSITLNGVHYRDIGAVLDRNDARVASVWMDEYADVFFNMRLLTGAREVDTGDLSERRELRQRLQCRSFRWFLDNVAINFYRPDVPSEIQVQTVTVRAHGTDLCLDSGGSATEAAPALRACRAYSFDDKVGGMTDQLWTHTSKGYLQSAFYVRNKELACLRVNRLAMHGCGTPEVRSAEWRAVAAADDAARPSHRRLTRLELHTQEAETGDSQTPGNGVAALRGMCLTRRIDIGDPSGITLAACSNTARQLWRITQVEGAEQGAGTISDPAGSQCFDNMQRSDGPVGYYGCHGGSTQRWKVGGGRIQSTDSTRPCIGLVPAVSQFICAADDDDSRWTAQGDGTLRPTTDLTLCLTRGEGDALGVDVCRHVGGDQAVDAQRWDLTPESAPSQR